MTLILTILLTRETVTNDGGGVVKEGWMVAPYLGQKKKWEF